MLEYILRINFYKGVVLMKILHTSDWHLGKNLEGFSRLEEQEEFVRDFVEIV
jgi:DNA repair protein SbcD/Mre11